MEELGFFEVVAVIICIVISIMLIVAILKIPKIAKYQRATMLLTAYMARKEGVNEKVIKDIIVETKETIVFFSGDERTAP